MSDLLPAKATSLFNRFGQSLKDGEAIEFCNSDGVVCARYDKAIRYRIVSESPPPLLPIHEKITVRGFVTEVDSDKRTWTFMFNDGRKVSAPLAVGCRDDICDALKRYKPDSRNNPRVLMEGLQTRRKQ